MGSLLVLQIYERLSEHNKLRMEHENDRHIGDAAALMILTIILGAMILYFIKHRYKVGDSLQVTAGKYL